MKFLSVSGIQLLNAITQFVIYILLIKSILKIFLFILLFFIAFSTSAQQGLQMEFTEPDSVEMSLHRQMEYQQLISGLTNFLVEDIKLPNINYREEYLKRYSVNLQLSPTSNYLFGGFNTGMANSFHSPFYRNGKILSSAAYQISDKFTFGGFSYGANSIFSSPNINQRTNNFDSYGSTLFMEYKVSKKFKIETRINVSKGKQHPGF